MDQYLEVSVHNEFAKRMEEEHTRQNNRITELENEVKENRSLVLSVERLTTSVKAMVEEQKEQGRRLDELEHRDGEMWRKVIGYVVTTVVGLVLGFIWTSVIG